MARSSLLGGLGRLFGPAGAEGDAAAALAEARSQAGRALAEAAAQKRRADAAQAALEAVRERLDALEMELYVARSDQQRAAVEIEALKAERAAPKAGGASG